MSDSSAITGLLRAMARRARALRWTQEAVDAFGFGLLTALLLALWNATLPESWGLGNLGFGAVAVATVGRLAWRLRSRDELWQSARHADQKAGLDDELVSAYWFSRNDPHETWTDMHLERASETARGLSADRLVPWERPRRLFLPAIGGVGLLLITLLPVPRVFEGVVERLGEIAAQVMSPADLDPVAELQEATGGEDPLEAQRRLEEEQLLLPDDGEEGEGPEGLPPEDAPEEEQPEGSFMEGDEEGEPGEQSEEGEGEQQEAENPEEMEGQSEGEPQSEPQPSDQEGQGESTEQSGTTMPGGDEVFLQEGGEDIDQMQLGEEEVGHATRDGGEEQELEAGEISTLDVQLEREMLALPELQPEEETDEEEKEELVTKSEKSFLDFEQINVPTEFADQELLQIQAVPWKYRQLVMTYFKALRERDNQKEEPEGQ